MYLYIYVNYIQVYIYIHITWEYGGTINLVGETLMNFVKNGMPRFLPVFVCPDLKWSSFVDFL